MSATVQQCRGWWPNLIEAICEDCQWTGPTRDAYKPTGTTLARIDADEHNREEH